jgi:hypothetical protein
VILGVTSGPRLTVGNCGHHHQAEPAIHIAAFGFEGVRFIGASKLTRKYADAIIRWRNVATTFGGLHACLAVGRLDDIDGLMDARAKVEIEVTAFVPAT